MDDNRNFSEDDLRVNYEKRNVLYELVLHGIIDISVIPVQHRVTNQMVYIAAFNRIVWQANSARKAKGILLLMKSDIDSCEPCIYRERLTQLYVLQKELSDACLEDTMG
jgi:hypothetical protein